MLIEYALDTMLRYDSSLFSRILISYFHIVDDKNICFGVESEIDKAEQNDKRVTKVEFSGSIYRCDLVLKETSLALAFV